MKASKTSRSSTGLSRLIDSPQLIGDGPTGLCTNYTGVTDDLRRGVDALIEAGVALTALFTPEHGYWGAIQAGEAVGDSVDTATGLPIIDTYLCEGERLDALLKNSGVAQLLVDFQDIGSRFYTYTWTLFDLLGSAARLGIRIVVLDRPNPLGSRLSVGPGLETTSSSFVGRVSIPLQHGLTLGELALWFNSEHIVETVGRAADLQVIEVSNWNGQRQSDSDAWVMPSPNMPTLNTATVFPAVGLLEGTTLSEGRGTTRPFELFGAGWTDSRLAAALNEHQLPGVIFREAVFRPTFSKWSGETVDGAQLHLLDAEAFDPITTGVTVLQTLAQLYPNETLWLAPQPERPPFIDLLWGSSALREGIDRGDDLRAILAASPATPEAPATARLYV